MQGEKDQPSNRTKAPLFTSARFDEDSIFIYPLLAILTIIMYVIGFSFLSIAPAIVLVTIFVIEACERISIEPRGQSTAQIIGEKCVVIRRVSNGERGVVKIISSGTAQWELWSAESKHPIEAGSDARVRKRNGLFLQIEPLG